ncbi:MAG: hypothetical protein IK063_06670 [Clostridia bacterium]|nr:hypothetical protein [Clostridia bacterium]
MRIDYYTANPTGNITLLAETPAEKRDYKTIADRLMALNPRAEQAGFIGFNENGFFLNMAGGEFCGNASMSAAAVFAQKQGINPGEKRVVTLRVSGAEEPVNVSVKADESGAYECEIQMPPAKRITEREFSFEGKKYALPVVESEGISHIIFEGEMQKKTAEKAVVQWCDELNAGCLGIMFADFEKNTISPLVYARDAGTLFWENSCASGTTAAGLYLAEKTGRDVDIALSQPGGALRIKTQKNARPLLCGSVRIEKKESTEI